MFFYAVPFIGELDPHLTQCRLDRGLDLRTKWHLHPSSRLATTDMGQKLGGYAPFGERELGSHLKQYVAWAETYLRAKFHLDPSNRLVY